ncbi:MAG: hypothetical protein K0R62_2733 [Nonomuraea muscovyensis]|nr:hypothetical protein [Nonomuraea muscovyensis]
MPGGDPLRADDPAAVGPYRLVGRLGAGGQGVVYLAQAPGGRPVAVKVLGEGLAGDGGFAKEIEAARRVEPFCIAQVLDASLGGRPYIVTEYVDGPPLQQAGRHTNADLQRLAVATATALAAIHRAGVVHRDFKPANVLLGRDGPRVIDFGIARATDAAITVTSAIVGTPAYMAPEQLAGQVVGPQADVFAWAGVMVFAATGAPPFGNDSLPAVIRRILHDEPRLGDLPEPLRRIVYACLAKDPRARPAMQDVLLWLIGGRPVPGVQAEGRPPAPPAGPGDAPERGGPVRRARTDGTGHGRRQDAGRRRRRNLLVAASAAGMAVALASAVFWVAPMITVAQGGERTRAAPTSPADAPASGATGGRAKDRTTPTAGPSRVGRTPGPPASKSTTGVTTPRPATSGPADSGRATSRPTTSRPATSRPTTSTSATSGPTTSGPATRRPTSAATRTAAAAGGSVSVRLIIHRPRKPSGCYPRGNEVYAMVSGTAGAEAKYRWIVNGVDQGRSTTYLSRKELMMQGATGLDQPGRNTVVLRFETPRRVERKVTFTMCADYY